MELKFLTPTEVWEGFDPAQGALENSIVSSETVDNLVCSKQFFTAETTDDGRIRAYCEIYYDKRWADDRAAVLILPSLDDTKYISLVKRLVENGYVACILDYCGLNEGDAPHTTFPKEYSYASLPECLSHLTEIDGDARRTPWFVWAKIARKAISCLQEQRVVAADRIGVMGLGTGAQIAWQVAGMDKRVRALVPINGDGYLWAEGKPRFASSNIPSSDEEVAFSTGVGAESYAKFVTCPTFIITSADSTYSDVDRAGDILSFVRSKSKQLIITRGSDSQISVRAFELMLLWLRNNFARDGKIPQDPSIEFTAIENGLYIKLNTRETAADQHVYICYGEPYPFARYWKSIDDTLQKTGEFEYTCNVPVFDPNELIVAYATVSYPDGNAVSTPVIATIPSKLHVTDNALAENKFSHIIYNSSMGIGSFTAITDDALLDESVIYLKDGPFNIKGISTTKGSLSLCHDVHDLNNLARSAALHLDAYSPTPKTLYVEMSTSPEKKKYSASYCLNGGEFWQKVLLEPSDFKSENGKTLSKFSDTKQLIIVNAEGVAFNNFLWI